MRRLFNYSVVISAEDLKKMNWRILSHSRTTSSYRILVLDSVLFAKALACNTCCRSSSASNYSLSCWRKTSCSSSRVDFLAVFPQMHVPVDDNGFIWLLGVCGEVFRLITGLRYPPSRLAPAVKFTPETYTSASSIRLGMCKDRSRCETSSSYLFSSSISFLCNSFAFYISFVKSLVS